MITEINEVTKENFQKLINLRTSYEIALTVNMCDDCIFDIQARLTHINNLIAEITETQAVVV